MIKYETHEVISHVLTPEGSQIAEQGSHEARVWAVLPAKGDGNPMNPAELKKLVGDETAKVGQGRAFKNGWIAKEGTGLVKIVRAASSTMYGCLFCCSCMLFCCEDIINRGYYPERSPRSPVLWHT